MSILKLSKNDIIKTDDANSKIKLKKNQLSYDSSMVSTWESSNKDSLATLNKYTEKLKNNEYMSSDDLKAYRKALDSYIDSTTRLRTLNKSLGTAYDEEDEKKWNDFVSSANTEYDSLSKYYSQFDSEDAFKTALAYNKEQEKLKTYDVKAAEDELKTLTEILNTAKNKTPETDRQGNIKQTNLSPDYLKKDLEKKKAELDTVLGQYGVKSVEELEALVNEKSTFLNRAKFVQKSEELTQTAINAPDFEEYSQKGAHTNNPSWEDASAPLDILGWKPLGNGKEIGNMVTFAEENKSKAIKDSAQAMRGGGDAGEHTDIVTLINEYMTDDEKAIYNYYVAKEGTAKANEYLDSIKGTLQARQGQGIYEDIEDNLALEYVFGAVAGLDQFASGIKSLMSDEDYIHDSAVQVASGMVREDLKDDGFKLPDFLGGGSVAQAGYDMITTTANMAPSILLSSMVNTVAPGAGAVVGAVTLGASASGNAYAEMLNLGYNKNQARAYSALVGASEAGLQYALGGIGALGGGSSKVIAKLLSKVDNAFFASAIKLGGSMLSEGIEESLQTILEPWFKSVVANVDYDAPDVGEVLYSGLLGALSAGILEGGGTVAGEFSTSKAGKQVINAGAVDRLAKVGSTFAADSVAYQLAGKINENTGAYTVGRLLNEVNATLTDQNMSEIVKSLERKGVDPSSAQTIAKWLYSAVEGETFTEEQIAALEENEVISKTFVDVIYNENSTVNQRRVGYNDVLRKLADEVVSSKSAETTADPIKAYGAPFTNEEMARQYEQAMAGEASTFNAQQRKLDQASKYSPESKASPESEFSASEDGKTTLKTSGEEVSIKEISSIKDGEISLRLDNGNVINAKEVNFATADEALIYEAVTDMNAASANAMIAGFDPNEGIEVNEYILGFKEAYKYGSYGFPASEMSTEGFSARLTEAQKHRAYNLGKIDAKAKVQKAQEAKDSGKSDKSSLRKGKVIMDTDADQTSLTKRQKTSIKALEVVAETLGVNIHIFESATNEKGEHIGKNGWYDPSDNSIHIDLYAGAKGESTILFTAAHELTHFIREWSPAKFKIFADFLMEQYGEKGVSIDALVNRQIAKAKQNGRNISYDVAYEEVVADSAEAFLVDGDAIKKLASKDMALWEKIKSYLTELVVKIKNAYTKLNPDSVEGNYVRRMRDVAEKLHALWTDALLDAGGTYSATDSLVHIDSESSSVSPMLSERTWTASEYVTEREETAKKISKALGVDMKTAYKYIDDINGVARLIADDRARLDYDSNLDETATVLKPNSDYKYSVDMSTLCAKRLLFTGTFDAIQKALPNTVFDSEDIVALREMMQSRGYEVACGICYVESTRREIGRITQEFIERYKVAQKTGKPISRINSSGKEVVLKSGGRTFSADTNYTPNLGELNTTDIDIVKRDHREVYDAYLAFMNARGQAKPKLLETRAEYKGEILKHFKAKSAVEARNNSGGLRLQSFSDFEIPHLIDMMQIVMDMSRVGLKSQAYTKVPAFAEVFGDTGVKINLSLIAKGNGLDSNGNLVFDDVEGINHKEAFKLRDKYSKNVGTILVGKTDAHIIAAMADPRIDYIIPFHKSSWKESLYDALGLTGYADYTDTQNEKPIDKSRSIKNFDPSEYWDFSKPGDENAEIYLKKCREDGRIPKFPQFQGYPGYWKLLIDFKMYDNDGVGSPQEVVTPTFNTEASERILTEYEGGHRSFPVAKDVVDDFVKEHEENVKYSDRYLSAVPNSNILSMLDKIDNGNYSANEKVYFGIVSDTTATAIYNITGIDVKGFKIAIEARQIEHIIKDHGKNGTSDKSMQNPSDIAKIEYALNDYDDIRPAGKTQAYTQMVNGKNRTADTVLYEKSIGEKSYYVVQAVPDTKAKTLYIVTAFIGKKGYKKEAPQLINAKSSDVTAKTGSADASANIISQEQNSVKKKFSYRDSDGNELSEEQQEFFENSKVRDKNGNLMVVYHGTANGGSFTIFDGDKLGNESRTTQIGQGFYFTNVKKEAEAYMHNADIYGRIRKGKNPHLHQAYLNITNPFNINTDKLDLSNAKAVYSDGTYDYFFNNWIPFYLNNKTVDGRTLVKAEIQAMSKDEKVSEYVDYLASVGKKDVLSNMVRAFPYGKQSELLTAMKKHLGCDGIVEEFRPGEYQYVAFSSEQVKSTANKKPTSDPDIRYSERDNEYLDAVNSGDMETAQRMVDEAAKTAGYTIKAYHGTNADFTVFDKNRVGKGIDQYGAGFYFASNPDVTEGYGKKRYDTYLNIKKPINLISKPRGEGKTLYDVRITQAQAYKILKQHPMMYDAENSPLGDFYDAYWDGGAKEWMVRDLAKKYDSIGALDGDVVLYRDYPNELHEAIRNVLGYDGVSVYFESDSMVDERNDYFYVAWFDNQMKSSEPIVRDNNGNVIPLSERFNSENNDIRYSERDTDSVSNRSLLADALESVAQNDIERAKLAQYKSKLALLESEQAKLSDLKQQANELRFKKGRTAEETKKMRDLEFEANQTANRINTYDRQLLNLESTKALKGVLEREKNLAYKKAEKKGKEALSKYREKAAKTQRDLLEKHQQSRKEAIDKRHRTEMRHKIKSVVSELNQLLLHGSKERNIKLALQPAVASALEAVNFDTVAAEERVAKYNALIAKATDPDVIESLTRSRDNIQSQGDAMASRLENLRRAYADIKANKEDAPDHYRAEAAIIEERIDSVISKVGNTPLRNMTLSQLEAVYELYRMVLTTVRNVNSVFKQGKLEDLQNNVSSIMTELSTMKTLKEERTKAGETVRGFSWNEMIPVYAFERIGSKTFTSFFWETVKGQNTFAEDISEADDFASVTRKKYGYNKWDVDKIHEFKLTDGRNFRISLKHMMSIYAYSKRDQAHEHMLKGGFFFNDKETFRKKGGVLSLIKSNEEGYSIDDIVLGKIKNALTKEQILYVDEMQDYLTKMGEKGNEVSRVLWGIDIFKEKVYFPLKSSRDFIFQANQTAQEASLKNDGMTKEIKPGASNPIVLEAFDDVWASHVNRMSQYHAFVLPIENLNKIHNYGTWAGTASMSVSTMLSARHGNGVNEYLTQFIQDLNGASSVHGASNPFFSFVSKFKKTAVAASASVVVQQPTAVLRALAVMDMNYFIGLPEAKKLNTKWEEMKKYAPITIIKEIGGFDAGAGRQATEWLSSDIRRGVDKVAGTIDDLSMMGAALGDQLGWSIIWEAVKREIKATTNLKEGSEAFLEKAGERFTEVIVKTQVYDSTLSRSGYMRSKHDSVKMLTAFMGEPTVSFNMLYTAVTQAKNKKMSKRQAGRIIGAVYASTIAASAAASLIYALRDDDDDESYAEKLAEALGGKLLDDINPLNMLPAVRDIVSIFDGWDVERTDVAIFKDIKDAFDGLGSSKKSTWRKIEDFAGAIASAFGLPLKNVMRSTREIYNAFKNAFDGIEPYGIGDAFVRGISGDDKSKSETLYDAVMSGQKTRIEKAKKQYKDQSSIDMALRQQLRENDPRIKKAAKARLSGDNEEYIRIVREIKAEGNISQDLIVNAVNTELESIRKAKKNNK